MGDCIDTDVVVDGKMGDSVCNGKIDYNALIVFYSPKLPAISTGFLISNF